MFILGITGPTGSGKSLLCRTLSQRGIPVIDADRVYHGLLIPPSPCLDALRSAFGDGIFLPDGSPDRKALSAIVFSCEEKLALLNRTVLGFVLDEIRAQIRSLSEEGFTHVAVDGPTLIESGFHRECHTVISVLSPAPLRLARIMERDGLDRARATARISAQPDDDFYRSHSHYCLINDGDAAAFSEKALDLINQLGLPSPEAHP